MGVLSAIGAIVGGITGKNAADDAARAQAKMARQQIKFARETRNLNRADAAPYVGAGNNALAAYSSELGIGPTPSGYGGFQKTQDYTFGLNEGMDAMQAGLAARGGLLSGAALQAANEFGQNYASTRRDGYLNKLAGMAGMGQAAVAGQAANNWQANASIGNSLGAIGDARAAGAIGGANALNGTIDNLTGLWAAQKAQNPQYAPPSNPNAPGWFNKLGGW